MMAFPQKVFCDSAGFGRLSPPRGSGWSRLWTKRARVCRECHSARAHQRSSYTTSTQIPFDFSQSRACGDSQQKGQKADDRPRDRRRPFRQRGPRRGLEAGMKYPVVMPHLGATGGDVKIIEWLVAESDSCRCRRGASLGRDRQVGRRGRVAPGEIIGYLSDDSAGVALASARQPALESVRVTSTPAHLRPASTPANGEPRAARVAVRLSPAQAGRGGAALAERLAEAFATMVLIRRYEEHLYQLFLQGLVPGTLHQCQG
jgi:hypothetical protein